MDEHCRSDRGLEGGRKLRRRHWAPYLVMTSNPLVGPERAWRGLRFWALDDDSLVDSEEDDTVQKDSGPDDGVIKAEQKLLRDANRVGFSVDDVIRAESLLTENFNSPKFASLDKGAGHTSRPQPLASRISEAVADLRLKKSGKSWRGPLPRPRSPHTRQLGDILVKDLRSSNETVRSLKDLGYLTGRHINFDQEESERGKIGLGSGRRRALGHPGVDGLARIETIKVGSHPSFRPTRGLNNLFNAGGVPRRLAARRRDLNGAARSSQVVSH